MELKVIKPFRDKLTQKKVNVGDVVNTDDLERVNDLVARGFCIITSVENSKQADPTKITLFEKEFDLKTVKDALGTMEVKVAANAGIAAVEKKIAELTEDQKKTLSETLSK